MRLPSLTLPSTPDVERPLWRIAALALLVTAVVGVCLGSGAAPHLTRTLGDTDDATRVVLVRELLAGRGWWDQHWMRMQPPVGLYMHWSRLLDGGIALVERAFALVVPWPQAEWLTRLFWPLLWVWPAVFAMMVAARRLGERTIGAVIACTVILVLTQDLYGQFRPGRVDHHDVQMTCFFLALAGALQRGPRVRGAVLAGAATGIGMAVGLEALILEAVIGSALALRFVFDAEEAGPLFAYGASLLGVTLLSFLVQTPPLRWTMAACDALAFNSTAAVVVAGLAVMAASRWTRVRPAPVRFGALAMAAVLTAAVYLALDPHCIRGPFADVDPRIRPLWLNYVQEVRTWQVAAKLDPAQGIALAVAPLLGLIALAWLGRTRERRGDAAWRLSLGLLLVATATGYGMVRAIGYAEWLAVPPIAAAAAEIALRYRRVGVIAPIMAGLIFSPVSATGLALLVSGHAGKPKPKRGHKPDPPEHCYDAAPYRALAAAGPPGLALSEIDLGPFILAHSKDSVMAAPYHRMSWGIITAHNALGANAVNGAAEARARALGVRYVVNCPTHSRHGDRSTLNAASLQKVLDADHTPPWLEKRTPAHAFVNVYRVRPALAAPDVAAR